MPRGPIAVEASLERPLFGEVVRQVADVSTEEIDAALQQQRTEGGKLGDVLTRRGAINEAQRRETLDRQAQWVAASIAQDLGSAKLPYPAFLSVCMPAFNEAQNIQSTIEGACVILPHFVEDFEVVVVDDGSSDATAEKVAEYAADDPRVRLVSHPQNRGYGAAVTTGLRAAAGELVMFTDSDGQFSLLDLPRFLAQLSEYDVVVGYRFDRADSAIRKLNAKAWTKLISILFGVKIRDLDCAFKIFRRDEIDSMTLDAEGAAINAQIMMQCTRRKLRVSELPVMHYPCYHGEQTGANLKVILKAFGELKKIRACEKRLNLEGEPRRPVAAPPHTTAPKSPSTAAAVADRRG